MKLRNKKTGDIYELNEFCLYDDKGFTKRPFLKSLAELNEEWEDYEEPKEDGFDNIITLVEGYSIYDSERYPKEIVEKLKAVKRLKDKGFRFSGFTYTELCDYARVNIKATMINDSINEDLKLLFGGEE